MNAFHRLSEHHHDQELRHIRFKLLKKRAVTSLSIVSSLVLCYSVIVYLWAELKLPRHKYIPEIGEYIGPTNISVVYLGLFSTSHGSYSKLFKDPKPQEMRKVYIVTSMLIISVISTFAAGLFKALSSVYCPIAKKYKGSALLNVLAVVLNIGSFVVWYWFARGFTFGRYTLGAQITYSSSVYFMLGICGLLIIVIALDFISCKGRRHRELPISPSTSEPDVSPINLTPDNPPPYEELVH